MKWLMLIWCGHVTCVNIDQDKISEGLEGENNRDRNIDVNRNNDSEVKKRCWKVYINTLS